MRNLWAWWKENREHVDAAIGTGVVLCVIVFVVVFMVYVWNVLTN